MAAAFAIVAGTACDSTGNAGGTESIRAGSFDTTGSLAASTSLDAASVDGPLLPSSLLLPVGDPTQSSRRVHLEKCMQLAGFEWFVLSATQVELTDLDILTDLPPSVAEALADGFGLSQDSLDPIPTEDGGADPIQQRVSTTPGAEDAANRCASVYLETVALTNWTRLNGMFAEGDFLVKTSVTSSQEWQAVLAAWTTCMAAAGFAVTTLEEARDLAFSSDDQTHREIAVSAADCDSSTLYSESRLRLTRMETSRWVEANVALISEIESTVQKIDEETNNAES